MKTNCFIILLSCLYLPSNAQFIGAKNTAMGEVSTSQEDVFSSLNNISKMGGIEGLSIGVSSQRVYMIKSLHKSNLVIQFPLSFGAIGMRFYHYGFHNYFKNQIEIAYAVPLSSAFSMGVKLNALWLTKGEKQRNKKIIFPNLGLNYRINSKLETGIILHNLSLSHSEKNSPFIPTPSFLIGLSYFLNPSFDLHFESELNIENKIGIKVALEYKIHSALFLRSGVNTNKKSIALGIGIQFSKWTVDLASSFHPTLGFSPAISLSYVSCN